MNEEIKRRRVLCVLPKLNPKATPVLTNVTDEWIYALALHCDVKIVEEDFDFKQVCDEVKPDLIMFAAVHWGRPFHLDISNIDQYPEIPRALYFNCDPHDPMRPLTLQLLKVYGIDTIFCPGIEHLQHMPELSNHTCFIIPKFIDAHIFHDYAIGKTIPVSIFGAHLFPSFYAWRAQVTEEIQRIYPTLLYTHPGYNMAQRSPFEVRDESYAKLISQSHFSIADTTRLDYVVRKHLEIPASGTILIAPDSEPLKEYGFIDMENCILGSGSELYKKINSVIYNQELYSKIRQQGFKLIHGRYTRDTWTYIPQWLECRLELRPGQAVRQPKRFGGFEIGSADARDVVAFANSIPDSPMSKVLRQARQTILYDGDLDGAVASLMDVSSWIGHVAEPWFLLGIIALLKGDLDQAVLHLTRRGNAQGGGNATLGLMDPCEIAWLMLVANLTGDENLSRILTGHAKTAPHLSIRRIQWLLKNRDMDPALIDESLEKAMSGDRMSINWIGQEDFATWLHLVSRIVAASGKQERAAKIERFLLKYRARTSVDPIREAV